MRTFLCVIIAVFYLFDIQAQDERLLRQMLSGQLVEKGAVQKESLKFTASGPRYYFDLNGDNREERFYFTKEDGEDWLYLSNFKGEEIYRFRFTPMGSDSGIYRVSLKRVNKNTTVAIFHYFEGKTDYLEKRGTSRIYFMGFQKGELKNFNMFRGPQVWDEYLDHRKHYHRRNYKISMYDYDGDGNRELTVKFHTISRVYRYENGKWFSFPENPNSSLKLKKF